MQKCCKLLALLLAVAILCSLIGCNRGSSDSDVSDNLSSSPSTTAGDDQSTKSTTSGTDNKPSHTPSSSNVRPSVSTTSGSVTGNKQLPPQPIVAGYYQGEPTTAANFVAKPGSAAGVQAYYDSLALAPTFFSPWAKWTWNVAVSQAQTVQVDLKDEFAMRKDGGLLFYVKVGSSTPQTTLGLSFSEQGIGLDQIFTSLVKDSPVYLLSNGDTQWTATPAITETGHDKINGIVLPAGFEGWVRVPYTSINVLEKMRQTLDIYTVRMHFPNVNAAMVKNGFSAGSFTTIKKDALAYDKICVEDEDVPVKLFPTTYTQTSASSVLVSKTFSPLPATESILFGNPDRGFRSEEKYVVTASEISRVAKLSDTQLQQQIRKKTQNNTRGETPTVSRLYFKLQAYADKDTLPKDVVTYMNRILAAYKALGIRAYICVYYVSDYSSTAPEIIPPISRILKHMDSYAEVFKTSKDAIAAVCLALVGADGEVDYNDYRGKKGPDGKTYSSSLTTVTHDQYQSVVTKMLTKTLPSDVYLVMDKPILKYEHVKPLLENGTISKERYQHIGFDEAGMFGLEYGSNGWDPTKSDLIWDGTADDQWDMGIVEAAYAYNDAETAVTKWFYNPTNKAWKAGRLIGNSVLQSLSQQWTASLSAYHSNADTGTKYNYEQTNFYRWKNNSEMKVTAKLLESKGLLYTKNWFKDENGNIVTRSVYDYLRDYLGYRLSLDSLTVTGGKKAGESISVKSVLKNYGFGAPVTMTQSGFAILDASGNVVSSVAAGNPTTWHSTDPANYSNRTQLSHTVSANMTLPKKAGTYKLAFYLRNSAGNAVRLDNQLPFENGYQILHTFKV